MSKVPVCRGQSPILIDKLGWSLEKHQVFDEAVKHYCAIHIQNDNCRIVAPSFSTCRIPTEMRDKKYYELVSFSRMQIQSLVNNVEFIYNTEGRDTEYNYSVTFLWRGGKWTVTDITNDPPCAG